MSVTVKMERRTGDCSNEAAKAFLGFKNFVLIRRAKDLSFVWDSFVWSRFKFKTLGMISFRASNVLDI